MWDKENYSGCDSRKCGKSESDISGKFIDARHALTHEVVAPIIIRKYRQLWNTVREAAVLKLLATCEYVLKVKSTTVPAYLIRHEAVQLHRREQFQ